MRKLSPILHEKLGTLITAMGFEFVGYEFARSDGRTIFRIFIDKLPKGVSVDDCGEVSRQISAMLDVEDPIQERYNLEVSSPGIDRPLFDLSHYQQQLGQRLRLRLRKGIEKQRNFVGVLKSIEGESLCLLLEKGEEVQIPFSDIDKANVIADLDF